MKRGYAALIGNLLKIGSINVMLLPIHRIGWGRDSGSPSTRSKRNAAGSAYNAIVKSITLNFS